MNALRAHASQGRQAGLTLLESLITLAVSAVVLGTAVPNLQQIRERRQIDAAAAMLETDIQHARSLAVATGGPVRLSFESSSDASCYVVHTGNAGDCSCTTTGGAVCSGNARALQSVRWGAETAVRIVSNTPSLRFDADRGTVTPTATMRVQGAVGAVHQVVNIMGRVRSCSPAPALPGYRSC